MRHSTEDTESLKDTLEPLGFARTALKTLAFNINARFESRNDKNGYVSSQFVGYKFEHQIKLEFPSDNDLLGKALYALAHSPVKPEFRISYTLKDQEAAKNALIDKAVTDARTKAEVLTKAAGVTLKDIQKIDYSWGKVDLEYRLTREEWFDSISGGGGSYRPDIEPDDIEVSDTVTVIWEIA